MNAAPMRQIWGEAAQSYQPRGELRLNEPMSRHTSWRVGGAAERFYRPADEEDLVAFLASLPADEPLFWLGLGSNLLVRDGGIPGTTIATLGRLIDLELCGDGDLQLGVGVSCAKVARFCAQQQLTGAEFLAGIPGTVGGALAMNAGAFGGETWPWVRELTTVDRFGVRRRRSPQEFEIGYRHVVGLPGEWFVSARFGFEHKADEQAKAEIKALLARRAETQPIGVPSCGSVFRNPPGDHAARLIEACGLKGFQIGDALVSTKHANFIVNSGAATAADIEALIGHVQQRVLQRHGVKLQPEVKIIGVNG